MGLIKKETIDKVKSVADIVDVISQFVELKKSGANYKGLSPFQEEKTPSFTVFPAKNNFKDFSSGLQGGVIDFLEKYPGTMMTFPEAIRWLANRYGIPVEEENGGGGSRPRPAVKITARVSSATSAPAKKVIEQEIGAIDDELVNRVLDKADIVDVVGQFVQLKKEGSYLVAPSPWNAASKPDSFRVDPAEGSFTDTSSALRGNVVVFLREFPATKMTYPQAIRWLGKRYGLFSVTTQEEGKIGEDELKELPLTGDIQVDRIYACLHAAMKYFENGLWNNNNGSKGLDFMRIRGFNTQVLEKFHVGYAVQAWDNLLNRLKHIAPQSTEPGEQLTNFTPEEMNIAGLVNRTVENGSHNNKRWYDVFRGRVMFPFFDLQGRCIGFGARIVESNPEKPEAKYINSRDVSVHKFQDKVTIFSKEAILYGLFQAKDAIGKAEEAFLLEGYTDVLSMVQAGLENSVASSGTALTMKQVELIKKFTRNVTLIYDGDKAGIKAALRHVDVFLAGEVNLKIVLLPDNKDPQEYMADYGGEALKKFIAQNKIDFVTFKAAQVLTATDPAEKAKGIKSIVRTIGYMPNQLTREVYLKSCAVIADIPIGALRKELESYDRERKKVMEAFEARKRGKAPRPAAVPIDTLLKDLSPLQLLEFELVRLMLRHTRTKVGQQRFTDVLLQVLDEAKIEFTSETFGSLYELLKLSAKEGIPFYYEWIHIKNQTAGEVANSILSSKYSIQELRPTFEGEDNIKATLNRLKIILLEANLADVAERLKTLNQGSEGYDKYSKIQNFLRKTFVEHQQS